ncbi:MAG: three-Cys-motif partner protein TcmP [Anaerolineae bacterium]
MSESDFFSGKRPWSKIKDAILGSYMSPYFAKMSRTHYPFLIIDAFAGPGRFDDGSPGSPLIICQAAERYAKGRYEAIFINLNKDHHNQLSSILEKANYSGAEAVHGDSRDVLRQVHSRLEEPLTIFLYMDPFGLKEASFDLIRPFIERNTQYSTEILINLQAPILHRLAARDAFLETPDNNTVRSFHETLSRVLGGDYWKKYMFAEGLSAKEREERVVEEYCSLLSSTNYLSYTGACPVQESRTSRAKYYTIFASRHLDAMKLFNDEMLRAFEQHMHQQEFENTLFADVNWQTWRNPEEIKKIVLDYVQKNPGKTRSRLWDLIVQAYFMRFSSSEYKKALNEMVKEGKIYSPTNRKQYRLNDNCILYPRSDD